VAIDLVEARVNRRPDLALLQAGSSSGVGQTVLDGQFIKGAGVDELGEVSGCSEEGVVARPLRGGLDLPNLIGERCSRVAVRRWLERAGRCSWRVALRGVDSR